MPRKKPKRSMINEETTDIGTGPVKLRVTVARAHGWTDAQIESAWDQISKIVKRGWSIAQRRHPERYRRYVKNGDILFVGAIGKEHPALTPDPKVWKKPCLSGSHPRSA